MTTTLTKIAERVEIDLQRFSGDARLYRMSPPIYDEYQDQEFEYVVVSAVDNSYAHETYIFGANALGEIVSWLELEGSEKNTTEHAKVLGNAGYGLAGRVS